MLMRFGMTEKLLKLTRKYRELHHFLVCAMLNSDLGVLMIQAFLPTHTHQCSMVSVTCRIPGWRVKRSPMLPEDSV